MNLGIPASLRSRPRERGRRSGGGPAPAPRGPARVGTRRLGLFGRCRAWLVHHLQAMFNTLGRMARSPVATLMTVAVIGIALALPTGLHVVLQGARTVGAGWEDAARISLFLRKGTEEMEIRRLMRDIGAMDEVATVIHIAPDVALEEFRRLSGFGDALDLLDENPLPSVLVVSPDGATPELASVLVERLGRLDAVERAQLDLEWLKRLHAMMQIGERAVLVLAVLLALAVLLIIGNTIRLSIQSRREEIVVQKLIGATDAFVRRPFLYNGLFHGVFGAMFAWLLVTLALLSLAGPVERLAALYDSSFVLSHLGPLGAFGLLGAGLLLGLLGAWWAVGRHIREIEPS
ncbi:MAG: permease-like cell division protein FtsX [Gammaproteobacteria bacterium]|jgi:cell division transport system permease protein|nr:permease-like cell division protein FtsX [Gammaproteobacteria bacterium]